MNIEILSYKKGTGKKSPGGEYGNGKRDKVVGGRPDNKPTRPSKTR
jgi:hypothetical protein